MIAACARAARTCPWRTRRRSAAPTSASSRCRATRSRSDAFRARRAWMAGARGSSSRISVTTEASTTITDRRRGLRGLLQRRRSWDHRLLPSDSIEDLGERGLTCPARQLTQHVAGEAQALLCGSHAERSVHVADWEQEGAPLRARRRACPPTARDRSNACAGAAPRLCSAVCLPRRS